MRLGGGECQYGCPDTSLIHPSQLLRYVPFGEGKPLLQQGIVLPEMIDIIGGKQVTVYIYCRRVR